MDLNKTALPQYSNDKIRTFSVNGEYVRSNIFQDFTEGGHDAVYDWIPDGEVWLDEANKDEFDFIALHELLERYFMLVVGLEYDKAHEKANKVEERARERPDTVNDLIEDALDKQPARSKSMNIIRRIMPLLVRKSATGEEEIFISTPNYDRGNDRVFPKGGDFTNYLKNPVIMWIHDYHGMTPSAGLPVAKNSYLKVSEDGIIAGPPKFLEGDDFAQRVKNAWEKGFINTASIGFTPIEYETNDKGGTDYKKWEMLEWSFAPIPMNAEAMRVAKSAGFEDLIDKDSQNHFYWGADGGVTISYDKLSAIAVVTKPEETENFIRVPVKGEGGDKHSGHRIRTIDISAEKGISALYCGECKVVITYLFSKDKDWTMSTAEAWVKDHEKDFVPPEKKVVSQAEIKDEIDYLSEMINEVGLNKENENFFLKTLRILAGDTAIEIKSESIKAAMDGCDSLSEAIDNHDKAHTVAFTAYRDLVKKVKDGLDLLKPPPQLPEEEDILESLDTMFEKSKRKLGG